LNKKHSEKEIILGCIQGAKWAEKELFYGYAPRMFSICKRYAKDDPQAKDYLQEGFIKIFEKIHLYDSNKGKIVSWMSRVITNIILNDLRKNNILTFLEDDEMIPDVEIKEELELIDDESIISCIRKLPVGYRNILNLYVFEDLSHKEIAEELGIAESTSRSQYTRAKVLLKRIIVESIPDIYEKRLA